MFNTIYDSRKNEILKALPASEYVQISTHLELINFVCDEILYDSGENPHFVYFPVDCTISLLHIMENGASMEFAMTGNEGAVGIPMYLGGETLLHRAMVLKSGYAYRVRQNLLMKETNRYVQLHLEFLNYTQSLIIQTAQTAVCNRFHTVEQQLCRRLLMILDRFHSNELKMTQEIIANLIGVRRECITETVGKLQKAGLIQHRRGYTTVLNREGLEARVCECYKAAKTKYDRLRVA